MNTRRYIEVILCLCFLILKLNCAQALRPRLLVVILEGMRWDMADKNSLQGFSKLIQNGVTVESVSPVFPSTSYPNWYSIVTGLYPELHGIVSDTMYDPVRNDYFPPSSSANHSDEHWWKGVEPIWVTAEKSQKSTALFYTESCQPFSIQFNPLINLTQWLNRETMSSVCIPSRDFWSWPTVLDDTQSSFDKILNWFKNNNNNRLAFLNFKGISANAQRFGPDSNECLQSIRDADFLLSSFMTKLDKNKLRDEINLVVLGDHGYVKSDGLQVIRLDDLGIADNLQVVLPGDAMTQLLPLPGKDQEVYDHLNTLGTPGLHVYRRQDIPNQYHIHSSKSLMPIVLIADSGYIMVKAGMNWTVSKGAQGYDPKNVPAMKTIFIAKGPAFRKGVPGGPIQTVDVYNLFCAVLGISPNPNNGSMDNVMNLILSIHQLSSSSRNLTCSILVILLLLILDVKQCVLVSY